MIDPAMMPGVDSIFWVVAIPGLALLGVHAREAIDKPLKRLENLEERIESLEGLDELTGLERGKRFALRVIEEVARSGRNKRTFSLLLVKVEHHEVLEKVYGSRVEEEVLVLFGERLREIKREQDHLAVLERGEYALLLPETDRAGGLELVDRILCKLRHVDISTADDDFKRIRLVVAAGLSSFPDEGEDFISLLHEARRNYDNLRIGLGSPLRVAKAQAQGEEGA